MENVIRDIIFECCTWRIEYYSESIDINLRNDNKKGAMSFIKQIENLLNFIDGVKQNDKKTN